MDRDAKLLPLGFLRWLVLDCLGGNTPKSPSYFDTATDIDIFTAFRDHVMRFSQPWQSESTDPWAVSLMAASRLLCGELAAADLILDHLPEQPFKHDQSIRYCPVLPTRVMAAVLPLPQSLKDDCSRRWLAGSPVRTEIRAWLDAHRDTLRWDEAEGVYRDRTPSAPTPPPAAP
jgi:hypothetical protein